MREGQVSRASGVARIRLLIAATVLLVALLAGALYGFRATLFPSASPPEPLSLGYIVYPGSVPLLIAQEQGFFAGEGLEVELKSYSSGRAGFRDVLEGKLDVALVAEIPLVLAAMKGERFAVIATIFSGEKDHAVIVRRDRGIVVPPNLKDRMIGVTDGTTSAFVLDMVLSGAGLAREDVRLVNLAPDALVAAMAKGELDAASTWHPYLNAMQKELGPRGLTFDGFDVQGLFTLTMSLVVRPEFLKSRPETAKRLLKAVARASDYIRANPEEAQKSAAARGGLDAALLRDLWRGYRFGPRLHQTLPIALEGASRWAIQHRLSDATEVPNFSPYIVPGPLQAVNPGAVSLIR